jgi:hypothetical protein
MTYFVLIALVFELINPSFVAASYTKEPAQDKMVFEIKPKSGPYVKYPAAPKPPKDEVAVAVKAAPTAKPAVKKVAKASCNGCSNRPNDERSYDCLFFYSRPNGW